MPDKPAEDEIHVHISDTRPSENFSDGLLLFPCFRLSVVLQHAHFQANTYSVFRTSQLPDEPDK
ncbi:hypothetical protein [Neisseria sp.]|uniref:hypothetical protein n=1 Tax=Neisseria sp. TaxID=192066 RepID=UPI0035A1BE45